MTLYDTIKEDLLAKILDGTYPEGQTIPTELELAEQYGVSRPTVRQAIQILADDGYLERRRRRGTIVTRPRVSQSFAMEVSSFDDALRSGGHVPSTTVLDFRAESAKDAVAEALELAPGAPVWRLLRLRYADGQPNVLVESYVPQEGYEALGGEDFSTTSLYEAMGRSGDSVATAHRRLEVAKADGTSCTLLGLEEGDPVIHFTTVARDDAGRAVEYSLATYRGESNAFEFDAVRPSRQQ
ncbi:GntR family transcriptional regulator [Olsenella sp. YH-ols2217]|uniref:GntR family transcriptional regulator n=1 Tax=Kribbibacterium absianum TaxID=3044210 RepID=A0ABT6ZJV7_9ACTN|nr:MULTISPECIES: GntR family transcriptional regulator [unclassified Olsenella]MDJ1122431.1 GntR family transcriptional regulator [Olsenella sp. YH-ols2216]MDJ1129315.1 GntR family transcriptional regulator [Olsenella sp. YH-ols2217]